MDYNIIKKFIAVLIGIQLILSGVNILAQGNPSSKFIKMDTDGNGLLNKDEYFEEFYIKDVNGDTFITVDELKNSGMITKNDTDGDGKISALEFLQIFINKDINKDNYLSVEEMTAKNG